MKTLNQLFLTMEATEPITIPKWYATRTPQLREFLQSNVLISKPQGKGYPVIIGEKAWWLDLEIVSALAMALSNEELLLVASESVAWQALKCAAFMRMATKQKRIHVLVHPLVDVIDEKSAISNLSMKEYLAMCANPQLAKLFLLSGLQWKGGRSKLPSSDLYRLRIKIATVNEFAFPKRDLESITRDLTRQGIWQVLTAKRNV